MTDDEILDAILAREKGYVDDPVDRGGCTKYGITIATLRGWRRAPVTCEDIKALSEREARTIYRALYIKPFANVDPEVKPQVVDIAVLSGVARAATLLTIAKANPLRPLNVQLVIERVKFYAHIVKNDPTQSRYISGWCNRALEFL